MYNAILSTVFFSLGLCAFYSVSGYAYPERDSSTELDGASDDERWDSGYEQPCVIGIMHRKISI